MILNHVALVCGSEKNSDRFYRDILGLNKLQSKMIPASLSRRIFNSDLEFKLINYGNDDLKFEIFISEQFKAPEIRIDHACLEIGGIDGFLERCDSMGVEILRIPKGESLLIFIKDFDGNQFEIKQLVS